MLETPPQGSALSQRQLWLIFMAALALHVLPLILADYAYIDDIWRSMTAGVIEGRANSWAGQGRILVDWLYAVLGGAGVAPDLFPLPLLLAVVIVARALASLTAHYFERPVLADVLVVLPLWFSPFFLQNLSYQYDGPAMGLALAACVWAITAGSGSAGRWLLGSLLLTAVLSLYQPAINVFAILCCIEILHQVGSGLACKPVFRRLALRLGQLTVGCLLYHQTAYRLTVEQRTRLVSVDAQLPAEILARLELIGQDIALLATAANGWVYIGVLVLAMVGLKLTLMQIWAGHSARIETYALGGLVLLTLPAAYILISGVALVLAHFQHGARLLMGWGAVMVMLAWLARRALVAIHPRLAWVLALPLALMLSMAFAYGRVLLLQKELQHAFVYTLVTTLQTHPRLQGIDRIYLYGQHEKGKWLPAARGTFKAMPVLRPILNFEDWVLSEALPRAGLTQVNRVTKRFFLSLRERSPLPVVKTRFFSVYRVDEYALVLLNAPREPEEQSAW